MKVILFLPFFCYFLMSCEWNQRNLVQKNTDDTTLALTDFTQVNKEGKTISSRFETPSGFVRDTGDADSFGHYLRNLSLKPHGSEVKLYDGSPKLNTSAYAAVVDLKIGNKDLHQCADAVMRLRAEYLWNQKELDKIHFNFTNGFRADYNQWMKGNRIAVSGNTVTWVPRKAPSNSYADFWEYLEMVFTYAGTLSLSQELIPIDKTDLQIGDVFIKGGSPGHAVIVLDLAINASTGKKMFLLGQSYMPAQEIQVLSNPNSEELSPWYSDDFDQQLRTAEWTFLSTELKRFKE